VVKCSKCGGKLKPTDNPKTPKGLFTCQKCKSIFREGTDGFLMLVTNNFSVYNDKQKPIPLKELKKAKLKTKKENYNKGKRISKSSYEEE